MFVILYDLLDLAKTTIGTCLITDEPLRAFKNNNFSRIRLYRIENEAPSGIFQFVLEGNNQLFLDNKDFFGVEQVDLDKKHLIAFEPSTDFGSFVTGFALEVNPFKADDITDKCIMLISDSEGPASWLRGNLTEGELDCGEDFCMKIQLTNHE